MYCSLAQLGLVLALLLGFMVPIGFCWLKSKLARLFTQIIIIQFSFICFAFLSLGYAYISSDFAILNVFRNSHVAIPALYKFTGIWSNHEGSMLLWLFLLSLSNVVFLQHKLDEQAKSYILAIEIILTSSLLSYVLLRSNPFIRLSPIPEQGMGFNPLLQDIGLAIHPPILYIGYITTAAIFACACAALLQKKMGAKLLEIMLLWALFSWSFLTIGIALGSWWAYRELGWGGYWFWDPVENASLLPWLTSMALIHSIYVSRKMATNYKWTILLALSGFLLAILATFLVRSGAVTSVHSFASDPSRGFFILSLLCIYACLSLSLFAFRAHYLHSNSEHNWLSRFGGISASNILWSLATGIILLSLLYPLLLEITSGKQITIQTNFFKQSFIPLLLMILLLLALTLPATWQNILPTQYRHFIYSVFGALILTAVFYCFSSFAPNIISLVAFFAGSLVIIRMCFWLYSRQNPSHKFYFIWLVHLLAGLLAMTIAILETNSQEHLVQMKEGDKISFAGFNLTYAKSENQAIDNYLLVKVVLYLEKDYHELDLLAPQIRYYPVEQTQTSEAAIYHNFFYDLYAVISETTKDGDVSIKLYFKPLISWLWAICLLMFICGLSILYLNIRKKSNALI